MKKRVIRRFGGLFYGDVFIFDGRAWEMLEGGWLVNETGTERVAWLAPSVMVDFVGHGIWPSDERLKEKQCE